MFMLTTDPFFHFIALMSERLYRG